MPTSYFKEAIEAIEEAQEILNSSKPNTEAIDENLSYALNCLNEVDTVYGCMADYEEACEEEEMEKEEQFNEKFAQHQIV